MNSYGSTRLVRPKEDRIIAGVCAGLARRFDLSVTAVRAVFLIFLLLPGSSVLVYLLLWLIMPNED